MLDVLGEDDLKMPAAKHEESIEALAPHGTREPLDGVRPRARIGVLMTPMPSLPNGVEGRGELRVVVAEQELGCGRPFGEVGADVSGLLGHPDPDGFGRHTGETNEAGVVFDEEQDVEASEQEGVDPEEENRPGIPGGSVPPSNPVPPADGSLGQRGFISTSSSSI